LEIDGQRTVPSIVAFTEKDYLVGKAAKAQVCTLSTPLTSLRSQTFLWAEKQTRIISNPPPS